MLDEIKYKTRKFSEDYIWFSTNNVNESWKDGYKALFFKADSSVNLFAEIENDSYRIFFDKIGSKRQDVQHRNLYCVLLSEGKRGSDSAKAMFRLLSNYLIGGKRNEIQNLFDEYFTAEFIDSVYEKNRDSEVEAQIHEHFNAIVEQLQDVDFQHEVATKNNSYIFTTYDSKANAFFTELEFITNSEPIKGIVSLVMTGNSVENKYLKEFDYSKFSRGLCLSMTTVEGEIIEKIIKELPPETKPEKQPDEQTKTVDPMKTDGTSDDNSPRTEGTTSIQNASEEPKETDLIEKIKNLVSSSPLSKLLPILSIILILTLIIVVRSCSKNDSSVQQKNDTEKIDAPKPSNDSLTKSTKDTLNK